MKMLISKLAKLAIAPLALLALTIALNAAYVRTDYYDSLNGTGKFTRLPDHIDIATFGN